MFEDIVAQARANSDVPKGIAAENAADLLSNDKIRIAVLGVGGAGCNTVNRIMKNGIRSAKTVAINTDNLHLRNIDAHKKVLIGQSITRGLGAGGFPEVAEKCAQTSKAELREMIGENELVFLAAGMGGGTGTGAAPVVAEIAKEQGAIVVSIVTTPFSLERARVKKAEWGLKELAEHSDTVAVIDNNRLVQHVPNLPITDAFHLADAITGKAVTGIADTIMVPSLLNIDYADVKSVMEKGGISLISIGEGKGTDKINNVVKDTLTNPLLDVSYEGAKGALLHIEGGSGMTLGECIEVGEKITDQFDHNANVKIGARLLNNHPSDTITTTAIVTGLKSAHIENILGTNKEAEQEKPKISFAENINYI